MTTPTLAIMAAGIGSRYGGFKQIDPVGPCGETLIDYAVYDAIAAGFEKIVFIISPEIEEDIQEWIGENLNGRCETVCVHQKLTTLPPQQTLPPNRKKPWGTAHALLCAQDVIDSPFAVINADDFYGRDAYQKSFNFLYGDKQDNTPDFCLIGYILANTLTDYGHVARGVCQVAPDQTLQSVVEYTKIAKFGQEVKFTENGELWQEVASDTIVSMNMWGFSPLIFEQLNTQFAQFFNQNTARLETVEYFLPHVVSTMIQKDLAQVQVISTNEKWFGMTYQEDKIRVQQALNQLAHKNVYPHGLWAAQPDFA